MDLRGWGGRNRNQTHVVFSRLYAWGTQIVFLPRSSLHSFWNCSFINKLRNPIHAWKTCWFSDRKLITSALNYTLRGATSCLAGFCPVGLRGARAGCTLRRVRAGFVLGMCLVGADLLPSWVSVLQWPQINRTWFWVLFGVFEIDWEKCIRGKNESANKIKISRHL